MLYTKFPENKPFSFERCSRKANHGNILMESHYHNFFEIYYIEKGSCNYFIDNKAYHLEAGDLVFIPDGIIHNILYRDNNESVRLLINCTEKYIPDAAKSVFSKKCYMYRNREKSDSLLLLLKK